MTISLKDIRESHIILYVVEDDDDAGVSEDHGPPTFGMRIRVSMVWTTTAFHSFLTSPTTS